MYATVIEHVLPERYPYEYPFSVAQHNAAKRPEKPILDFLFNVNRNTLMM